MATYDGRLPSAPHDKELYFFEPGDPSMSSTVSTYSDTIDLGASQVFANIPVWIGFDVTAGVSCLSVHSSAGDFKYQTPGFWVQDASDGSTFSDLIFVKAPASASLAITQAAFNAMSIGIVGCRRYLRLAWRAGFGSTGECRAWLRMGFTK